MSAKRFTGKTESDAVMNAAMELGIPSTDLKYTVIDSGSNGFLGLFKKPVIIEIKEEEKETETKETLSESESEAAATDENVLQLDAELSELLDKIYAIKGPDFDVETDTVDFDDEYAVSSYTGLTMDDVKKLDAAIVSEPMMGSQAYSLVLVRLKDKADAADIAQKMADGINPRKWVCVEADELTVVSKDNIIMLFMADHELYSMDDAVAAFTEVCGNPDNTYQPK